MWTQHGAVQKWNSVAFCPVTSGTVQISGLHGVEWHRFLLGLVCLVMLCSIW